LILSEFLILGASLASDHGIQNDDPFLALADVTMQSKPAMKPGYVHGIGPLAIDQEECCSTSVSAGEK
jgi:hypothetical protein